MAASRDPFLVELHELRTLFLPEELRRFDRLYHRARQIAERPHSTEKQREAEIMTKAWVDELKARAMQMQRLENALEAPRTSAAREDATPSAIAPERTLRHNKEGR